MIANEKISTIFGFKCWSVPCSRLEIDKNNILLQIRKVKELTNNKLNSKYIVSLCGSPSGEMFLFFNLLEKFKRIHCNGENPILLVDKEWKKNISLMFAPDCCCINLEMPVYTYDTLMLTDTQGITLFSLFPTTHYLKQDDLIRAGKTHYYECIAKDLGVTISPVQLPTPNLHSRERVLSLSRKEGLNINNFVIVCPEASTCRSIANTEWVKLIKYIKSLGYDVYLNATKENKDFIGEKQFFLTHNELMELAKYSKLIVGIRSGLMEILAVTQVPMIAIYPEIPDRIELKGVKALDNLNGFSMKKIPGLNLRNNVFEYTDTVSIDQIKENIKQILSKSS